MTDLPPIARLPFLVMQTLASTESNGTFWLVVTVVAFFLTLLGALGGIKTSRDWLKDIIRSFRHRANSWRQGPDDYYFRRLDVACRVMSPTYYLCHRFGELVSLQKRLKSFSIGIGPSKSVEITIRSLDNFELTEISDAGAWRTRSSMLISIGRELGKGESQRFGFEMKGLSKDGQPLDRHWLWVNEHRVDELVLRVAFTTEVPERVVFQVHDNEGGVYQDEVIKVDLSNLEAKKTIRWPKATRSYSLKW